MWVISHKGLDSQDSSIRTERDVSCESNKGDERIHKGTSCCWPLDRGALTVSPLTKVCSAQPGVQPIHNPFALDDLHRCIDEPFVLDLTHDLMRIEHKCAALVSGWLLAGSLNIVRKVTTMIHFGSTFGSFGYVRTRTTKASLNTTMRPS